MQYRVLETLRYYETNKRIEAGTISDLKKLSPKSIELLLAKGRIAEVQAPPLVVLPGFEERAAEYAERGIQDVNDMSGEEDDFDEALKWSTEGHDAPGTSQDFMTTPLGEGVFELVEVEDDELVD